MNDNKSIITISAGVLIRACTKVHRRFLGKSQGSWLFSYFDSPPLGYYRRSLRSFDNGTIASPSVLNAIKRSTIWDL